MNPHFAELKPYPFEKLAQLLGDISPPEQFSAINLTVGEPKHKTPPFILSTLSESLGGVANYPTTIGSDDLRESIAAWLCRRFDLEAQNISAKRHILPVNGTREALFACAQCFADNSKKEGLVIMPNPFYQIYEGATLLAGVKPFYINCNKDGETDFGNVPEDVWQRCQLIYICSPGNPTGTLMSTQDWHQILDKALKHRFIIAADECYSEIYQQDDKRPVGLLQAATAYGLTDFKDCLVFHSLSKRSSVPGMRSGFVAGDAELIEKFRLYRTYHGCSMPPPIQVASARAWQDEEHVLENRRLYREKFDAALEILWPVMSVGQPAGGFYLWPQTPVSDTQFAKELYKRFNVKVLPGSYLSRTAHGTNPGERRVRIALVPPLAECIDAAQRIAEFVKSLQSG